MDFLQQTYSNTQINPIVQLNTKWLLIDKEASWKKFVHALAAIGETQLAAKIAVKHVNDRKVAMETINS